MTAALPLRAWAASEPTLSQRVLARLKAEPGAVLPHEALYRAMWLDGPRPANQNEVLRQIVSRVRRRLPPGHALYAVWGKGYVYRVGVRVRA